MHSIKHPRRLTRALRRSSARRVELQLAREAAMRRHPATAARSTAILRATS